MGGEEKEQANREHAPGLVAEEDIVVQEKNDEGEKEDREVAPLSSLWMHADAYDQLLLAVAVLGSVAGGVCVGYAAVRL